MRGTDVTTLQRRLRKRHLPVRTNGIYDRRTQRAVTTMQRRLHQRTTGIATTTFQKTLRG